MDDEIGIWPKILVTSLMVGLLYAGLLKAGAPLWVVILVAPIILAGLDTQ